MAKPKHPYIIEIYSEKIIPCIHVYADELNLLAMEIEEIEGVDMVTIIKSMGMISISTNPRYDIYEIANEIQLLLTSSVPEAFRSWD